MVVVCGGAAGIVAFLLRLQELVVMMTSYLPGAGDL